ncbi:MAG: 50S ribosomal protein L25 [Candidatus Pacebacteria bacterium]|nr:50S ribosomal protein L25 [Candidatus Paceibacterota bacterium]
MLSLSVKTREILGKKTKTLRKKNIIPAVLYGPEVKNISLDIDEKQFEKIFSEVGESSLISLELEGKTKKDFQVLIHEVQRNNLDGKLIHVDFYAPPLSEEIIIKVPLTIVGQSPAIKDLGGTLVRDIHEIEIKGLVSDLPKEIKVDISSLKTFEDHILIKHLDLPLKIKVLKNPEDIIISVAPPEKVEEELAKPAEEKIEEVEKVEKPKKAEAAEAEEETAKTEVQKSK